jgi:virulence factor Mce-like protein
MSTRSGASRGPSTPFTNPVLVGTTIVVALIVGVFLSYNANKGLPFVKTLPIKAEISDAAELVVGSEVRIGGFRVGQVNGITAEPAEGNKPPVAVLEMDLDGSISEIPATTRVAVRPRSLLGAKYVELRPGDDSEGVIKANGTIPLKNAEPTPELDEAFNVFDADTRRGLQGTIRGLGDALAGRGADLNRGIVATARLLPPLQNVMRQLADPRTDLDGFIDGLLATTSAIGPVSDTLGDLLDHGAVTLQALDAGGEALGETIEELPPTEIAASDALRSAQPVLRDLADITVQLRGPAGQLPRTTNLLASALTTGTEVLKRGNEVTPLLNTALRTLGRVARDPAAEGALRKLDGTVNSLRPTVQMLRDAQVACNQLAIMFRNFGSTVSAGDASGTWLTFIPILHLAQTTTAGETDPQLHFSTYPTANATECEAGNEQYTPGQLIGTTPELEPTTTDTTNAPEAVTRGARAAGLLDVIPGANG